MTQLKFNRLPIGIGILFLFFISLIVVFPIFLDLGPKRVTVASITLCVLAFYRPKLAISLLLVSIGFVGHRPYDIHTKWFVLIQTTIMLGLYFNILFNKDSLNTFINRVKGNVFFYIAIIYIIVGAIGILFGVNGLYLIDSFKDDTLYNALAILARYGEVHHFFSLQSYLYNTISVVLLIFIIGWVKIDDIKYFILCTLLGFLISIFLGYIDFYNIVDLSSYYYIGDDSVKTRFTGLYGNSGWYAEYIAMSLPLSIILFSYVKNIKRFIFFYILLVIIIELALIYAMQRGAWITYPITLVVIWFAIYFAI